MAKYRLLQPAIINDRQCAIGEEIEYDGIPGPHMEPLDAAAKKAVADRDAAKAPNVNPDFQAHPAETTPPGVPGSPPASPPTTSSSPPTSPPGPPPAEDKDKKDEREDRHGRRG